MIPLISFEWKSTASDTLLGRTEDMFEMAPVSLETHFCSTQRGLRCNAAHGRRQAAHRRLYCILDVFKASWIALVHLGLQVTPQEKVQRSQVRGAGRPRARLKPGHQALSKVPQQPIPGFLGGVSRGTVLLEPLALDCFLIVVQPGHEDPPEFHQHRAVSLSVGGLGVAAAHRSNWGSEVAKTSIFPNGGVQRRRFLHTSSDINFTASVKI